MRAGQRGVLPTHVPAEGAEQLENQNSNHRPPSSRNHSLHWDSRSARRHQNGTAFANCTPLSLAVPPGHVTPAEQNPAESCRSDHSRASGAVQNFLSLSIFGGSISSFFYFSLSLSSSLVSRSNIRIKGRKEKKEQAPSLRDKFEIFIVSDVCLIGVSCSKFLLLV